MKVYDRIRVDQLFLATMGVLLFGLSLAGLFHGMNASLAAHWAWKAEYGTSAPEVEQVTDSCRRAFGLYPWNYYFSIFASELAYYNADEVTGAQREERLHQSKLWCERGLMQNRYRSQLRRLKTRFLWDDSPSEAIAYWEGHTNWQYWEPYNHETLAGLYTKYGEFDKAARELKLLVNFPAYETTRALIESEKKIWAE